LDTFTSKELDFLQDEFLADYGRESKKQVVHAWETHVKHLFKNSSSTSTTSMLFQLVRQLLDNNKQQKQNKGVNEEFASSLSQSSCFTFESFYKYVTISSSRSMVITADRNGSFKHLTPFPDMINYAPQPEKIKKKSKKQHDDKDDPLFFSKYHTLEDCTRRSSSKSSSSMAKMTPHKCITVKADRTVAAGQQLFEDYGHLDNSLYLDAFGFVPTHNPHHCAILNLSHLDGLLLDETDGTLNKNDLHEAMAKLGLIELHPTTRAVVGQSRPDDPCVKRNGELANPKAQQYVAMMGLMMINNNKNEHRQRCLDVVHASSSTSSSMPMSAITKELHNRACFEYQGSGETTRKLLARVAEATLNQFPTTLAADKKLLLLSVDNDNKELSERSKIALRFRIAEKELLAGFSADTNTDIDIEEKRA
jgi:hypothetical protein